MPTISLIMGLDSWAILCYSGHAKCPIRMNFTVYSKENCPYCYKIKQVLEMTNSKFVVYNLGEHFTREEFYGEFGEGATFPQVLCDDKKIGGCTDTVRFLKENQIV